MKEYAQGFSQSQVNPIADFISPTVNVPTMNGWYMIYDEKNKFKIPKTIREVGGKATRITMDGKRAQYSCTPRALDFPVDNLEKLEESELENIFMEGAGMVAQAAALEHETRVVNLAVANAPSSNIYFNQPTDDPVDQIDTAIVNVLKAARTGSMMGVGVVFGTTAFKRFKNQINVRSRFVTAGGNAIPNITTKTISELLFGAPPVMVSLMVQDTAAEGLTPTIEFILDDKILVFARLENPTRRDPSFMKTFRLAGQWMVPGSYTTEDNRGEVAKFDWSEDVQVTNAPASALLVTATH